MDVNFAAGLLSRMRPDIAAKVLTGMNADTAYAVTLTIASRNAAVPTKCPPTCRPLEAFLTTRPLSLWG